MEQTQKPEPPSNVQVLEGATQGKKVTLERPKEIPHQAVVRVNAVINQQMPNGQWHPRSAFNENFLLILSGANEQEVTNDLKNKLKQLKNLWKKEGGEIGIVQ